MMKGKYIYFGSLPQCPNIIRRDARVKKLQKIMNNTNISSMQTDEL